MSADEIEERMKLVRQGQLGPIKRYARYDVAIAWLATREVVRYWKNSGNMSLVNWVLKWAPSRAFRLLRRDSPRTDALYCSKRLLRRNLLVEETDLLDDLAPVAMAMSKLSPLHQEILRMRYMEQKSLRDCSVRFGCTYENIRLHQEKALRLLRERLVAMDVMEPGEARRTKYHSVKLNVCRTQEEL